MYLLGGPGPEVEEAVARARLAPPVACLAPVGPYQSMQTAVASSRSFPSVAWQDVAGEFLDNLAGMPFDSRRQDPLNVDVDGFAFEVAVGDQQKTIAGLELQRLGRVVAGLDAQGDVGGDLELRRSPGSQQIGPRVTGVDQFGGAVSETDADELAGDELVLSGPAGETVAGDVGLFGWRGERPSAVAQAADGQRGQERGWGGVAHGVGYRGVEELPVDGVVEGVPAGVVGGLQPAGDGERAAFGGVGRRQQPSLDLGGQGERDVPLRPLEQVGVPP